MLLFVFHVHDDDADDKGIIHCNMLNMQLLGFVKTKGNYGIVSFKFCVFHVHHDDDDDEKSMIHCNSLKKQLFDCQKKGNYSLFHFLISCS